MVAVIIHRTQSRENNRTLVITLREFRVLQKRRDIEDRAFNKDAFDLRNFVKSKMPRVRGKNRGVRIRCDWPRFRFQLAIEKFVKRFVAIRCLRKFLRIYAEFLDEWLDAFAAVRAIHPPSVPTRKSGSLYQRVQRQPPQRISISPAQEMAAINVLGLQLACVAVKILDRFHLTPPQFNGGMAQKQPAPAAQKKFQHSSGVGPRMS